MNNKLPAAWFVCLLLTSAPLFAQETTLDEIETPVPLEIPEDSGDSDGTESVEENLIRATLPLDISVSGYYDLLAWCRRLGLDETGNREALQNRLYQHYGVEKPKEENTEGRGSLLVLEDSDLLDYTTVNDNTNITFTGDVSLTFTEESGATHTISADILDFNQDEQIITAYGNVRYELKKEGDESPEVFTGNSLTFDVETWAGLFFQGTSQRDTTIKDSDENDFIQFYYYGDVIYRSSGDTVILSDGSITTCDEDDPHLEIRAKKIWVLAPGEWAIFNGVFYVGRVPMFYIPGFIKNGDPLFFNPTVGFVSNSGYTFQTTTYLLGDKEKKDEDSIIDFMQVSGEEDVEREIDGLFLRQSNGLSPFQVKMREYADDTNSTLKLMADVYSYLGVFTGVTGTLNKLGPVSKMDLYAGIAKSRQVYSSTYGYTPFYEDDDGNYLSNWENGYFLNHEVPFRFAFDVNMSMSLGKFSLGLDLPIYSDPYFLLDFDERKEDIELDEFSDFSSEDDSARREDGSQISSEKWELATSFKPSTGDLAPYLNTAFLNSLDFSMTWSRKSMDSDLVDSSIDTFFYPSGISYLDFSMSFGGKLYDSSTKESEERSEEEKIAEGLVSPWAEDLEKDSPDNGELKENKDGPPGPEGKTPLAEGETSGEVLAPEDAQQEMTLLIEDARPDLTVSQVDEIEWYSQNISWSFKPTGSFYSKFDSDDWGHPEEIDYTTEYQVFRSTGKASVSYSSSIADKFLSISNTLDGSLKYDNYFYRGDSLTDDEWETYQDQADALNTVQMNNSLTLSLLPLQYQELFKSTSAKYSLKTKLFLWDWDSELEEFQTDYPAWNEDQILTHSLSLNLKGDLWGSAQTLSTSLDLPPDEMSFSTSLNLVTGPLKSSFSLSLDEDVDDDDVSTWEKNPISLSETFTLNEYLTLTEKLTYDWDDEEWGESTTTASFNYFDNDLKLNSSVTYDLEETNPESGKIVLNLWDFSGTFQVKRQYPYTFSLEDGWQKEEGSAEEFLPDYLSFSYGYETKDMRLWKNRINFSAKVSSSWKMDLVQFTDSSLSFDLTLACTIHDFMTFSFASKSENDATFRYFPAMAEIAGVESLNPLEDLVKSFNFFDYQDRVDSNFNLSSITLNLTHDLHDWDLVLELDGGPEKVENDDGYYVYEWQTTFSIYVNWKAWSDLEAKVDINDNEIVF